MDIEKYSNYEFEIMLHEGGVYYLIYEPEQKASKQTILAESRNLYDSAFEARNAAIEQITQLENGEQTC
jgi:hypothetical protein